MTSEMIMNLRRDIKLATHDMLEEHHNRGALFMIAEDLDIATVGAAIATDESEQVKSWLNQNKLLLTKDIEWNVEIDSDFIFIIVQPYVLIQKVYEN